MAEQSDSNFVKFILDMRCKPAGSHLFVPRVVLNADKFSFGLESGRCLRRQSFVGAQMC